MRVAGAVRPGRGHRLRGIPCQDSFAAWQDPAGGRAVAAVADGLGSCPLSDAGSRAAVDAAVAALAAEPAWDEAACERAFGAARAAVEAKALRRGAPVGDLSTTLQLAALDGPRLLAAMVGDGAVVAEVDGSARIVLAPAESRYANEVVPATSDAWRSSFRVASADGVRSALLFTDGFTRLLLEKSKDGWSLFPPFFEAFLPRLAGDAGALDEAVAALVSSDDVDRAWDDDKCLVVMARD